VAHGCQAGLQEEARAKVYRDRILRRDENYSVHKLGAFSADLGAVACFFDTLWSRVSPALTEADQAWLLNEAAFRLRAVGRLSEALEPMRAGLRNIMKQGDWKSAAAIASNLSELELTLGEVAGAAGDAEQSVTYADRSGDVFLRGVIRGTHADALHQAGRRAEAEARFREAEQMQAERQPNYPLMYSLEGFRYCDLLLSQAERAAGQLLLKPKSDIRNPKLVESCRAISQRAAQTLKWAEAARRDMLSASLDHLTLGRAVLYRTIIEESEIQNSKSEIEMAVSGLRRAGTQDHLPRGLLSRAWLRWVESDADGARADLDEAWEIAERGPMRLFLADIYLYRARLFNGATPYPWDKDEQGKPRGPKDDLAAARTLIERCGYHRRDEELADAEEAAKSW
jgi:tetratricopeptide (TPR) repeat protein